MGWLLGVLLNVLLCKIVLHRFVVLGLRTVVILVVVDRPP